MTNDILKINCCMIFFMSSTSTRIVVVGASGFVGKNLRSFLNESKLNILAISRKNFRKHPFEVKIISTNLSDPKLQNKLKKYDALIHLIGIGRQTSKSTFEEINLNLTKDVIKICKNAGIKKLSLSAVLVFPKVIHQIILLQNTKLSRK